MTINYKNTSSHGKISFKDTLQRIWEGSETKKPGVIATSILGNPKVYTAPGVDRTTDIALTSTAVALGAASGKIANPIARLVVPVVYGLGDTTLRVMKDGGQSPIDALSSGAMDTVAAVGMGQGVRALTKNKSTAEVIKATELATREAQAKAIEELVRLNIRSLTPAERDLLQGAAKASRSVETITPVADHTVTSPGVLRPGTVTVGQNNQTLGQLDPLQFPPAVGPLPPGAVDLHTMELPRTTVNFSVPQGGGGIITPVGQKVAGWSTGGLLTAAGVASKASSLVGAPTENENEDNRLTYISPRQRDLQQPNGWFNQWMSRIFPSTRLVKGMRIIPSEQSTERGQDIRSSSSSVRDQTPEEMDAVADRPPFQQF